MFIYCLLQYLCRTTADAAQVEQMSHVMKFVAKKQNVYQRRLCRVNCFRIERAERITEAIFKKFK